MKAVSLMRLIPHINPARTSMIKMNFFRASRLAMSEAETHQKQLPGVARKKSTAGYEVWGFDFIILRIKWRLRPLYQTWGLEAEQASTMTCRDRHALWWSSSGQAFPFVQGRFLPWSWVRLLITNTLLQNYSGLIQNLDISCQREGLLWAKVGSWGLLLPQGHPAAAARAALPTRSSPISAFPASSLPPHSIVTKLDLLLLAT